MKVIIAKQGQTLEEIAWLEAGKDWTELFDMLIVANPELVDPLSIFLKGGEVVKIPDLQVEKSIVELSLW